MRRIWMTTTLLLALAAIAAGCGTVTLLPDGRVLLLEVTGKGKVYDPSTGKTVAVDGPSELRAASTWTLLNDGRLLVAGGLGADNSLVDTAELYDPAVMGSTATGSMTEPRAMHSATLLADGRVLVAGGGALDVSGSGDAPPPLTSAELYDPGTGTFSPTGAMTTPRALHTATLLADGRVLLVGGSEQLAPDLYDPGTGLFTATTPLPELRMLHTATLLDDGRVLVVGGVAGGGAASSGTAAVLASALLFDPVSETFTPTGDLTEARLFQAAVKLPDGRVLIAGGSDTLISSSGESTGVRAAEIYDPATGTFTPTGSLHSDRFLFGVLLSDGRVLIAGAAMNSSSGGEPIFTSGETWDPVTGEWTETSFKVGKKK